MARQLVDETGNVRAIESSNYFESIRDLSRIVTNFKRIMPSNVEYDTIVGTGLSGAIVVPILATACDKNFFIVRKPNVSSHSMNVGEGTIGRRWIFVDDFISTGESRERCKAAIEYFIRRHWQDYYYSDDAEDFKSEYVGSYQYERNSFIDPEQEQRNYTQTELRMFLAAFRSYDVYYKFSDYVEELTLEVRSLAH